MSQKAPPPTRGGSRGKRRRNSNRESNLASANTVTEALDTDLILGRGSAHAWRPANVAFHQLLEALAPQYYGPNTRKKHKTSMIQQIYHQMAQRGRFLSRVDGGGGDLFVQLGESEAKARISDAMRYRQRRRKQKSATGASSAAATAAPAGGVFDSDEESEAIPTPIAEGKQEEPGEEQKQEPVAQLYAFPLQAPAASVAVNQERPQADSPEIELFTDDELSSVLDHVQNWNRNQGAGQNR